MFSNRRLRLFGLLLLCCGAVGLLIWFGQERVSGSASRANSGARSQADGNDSSSDKAGTGILAAILPGQRTNNAGGAPHGIQSRGFGDNRLGLYNESVRSLMRANSFAKVDYGLFQLQNVCRSFLQGEDGVTAVRSSPSLPQARKSDELMIGNATEATRVAGFHRSRDKCTKLYEGVKLSQAELDAIGVQTNVVHYRTTLNTLGTARNFASPEITSALSDAVAGPMFGALSPLLASKVDYIELVNAYGQERADALRSLTIPLVLCRMGDDCGSGGLVTEQMCWENGICGDGVEDAIFANLRDRGLDTTAFNQFVTRLHQALQSRDTSIFRKPASGK